VHLLTTSSSLSIKGPKSYNSYTLYYLRESGSVIHALKKCVMCVCRVYFVFFVVLYVSNLCGVSFLLIRVCVTRTTTNIDNYRVGKYVASTVPGLTAHSIVGTRSG
jgi:hypothetical protein